jgi:hypothetical protein
MDARRNVVTRPGLTADETAGKIERMTGSDQFEKVNCPHCGPVGYGILYVKRTGQNVAQADILNPLTCVYCGRMFAIKARLEFTGVPLRETVERVLRG